MNESLFASVGCTTTGRAAFVQMQHDFRAVQLQIEQEAQQLIKDSRVSSSPIYLSKDTVRSKLKYTTLRWRQRLANAAYQYVGWSDCQPALHRMAPTLLRHYEAINRRASEINTLSKMVSHSLTCLEAHLKQLSASAGCNSSPIHPSQPPKIGVIL